MSKPVLFPLPCSHFRIGFVIGIILTAIPGHATPADTDAHITVNPEKVLVHNFRGWGTSLCWWAHVVGNFPAAAREEICDLIFDLTDGLGLNIVRFNIGGGETPDHDFMQFRARMPGYQPAPGQWHWTADASQQRVLLHAIAKGADHIEAFSNSPPHWMTISGSATGNHDGQPNLAPENEAAFIAYFVEAVAGLETRLGIEVDTVTPLNEPVSRWWTFGNKQEGCHIPVVQQDRLLRLTAEHLERAGLGATVTGPEENAVRDTIKSFANYSAETRSSLSHLNTHTYFPKGRAALQQAAATAGKPLWVSEYGDGDSSGLKMARAIIDDIRQLRAEAWIYWQAVDSGGGWGMLKNPLRNFSDTDYVVHPKYHVMAQFSRFVRPGMNIVAVNHPDVLAAHDPRTNRVVLVVLNEHGRPQQTTCQIFPAQLPRRLQTSYTGNEANQSPLENAQSAADGIIAVLPPRSVTTFVFDP